MRQLIELSAFDSPQMSVVKHLYNNGRPRESGFLDVLVASLSLLSQSCIGIYLVIDGIDECARREELLELLPRLATHNTRIVVTSRPEFDITQAWGRQPQLQMDFDAVYDDIRKHVETQVEHDGKLKRSSPQLKEEMIHKLPLKSNGM